MSEKPIRRRHLHLEKSSLRPAPAKKSDPKRSEVTRTMPTHRSMDSPDYVVPAEQPKKIKSINKLKMKSLELTPIQQVDERLGRLKNILISSLLDSIGDMDMRNPYHKSFYKRNQPRISELNTIRNDIDNNKMRSRGGYTLDRLIRTMVEAGFFINISVREGKVGDGKLCLNNKIC